MRGQTFGLRRWASSGGASRRPVGASIRATNHRRAG